MCLDDYYKEQSCIVNLQNVAIPMFVVNAKDDPLVIGEMIPMQAPLENKNLILVTTDHGGNKKNDFGVLKYKGHLSWAEGFILPISYWHERTALRCVAALLNLCNSNKEC